jgi:hypothetical protein
MPRKLGTPQDVDIGKLPSTATLPSVGRGEGVGTDFQIGVVPGSEDDTTLNKNAKEQESTVEDLDDHREAAELDHPIGSVKAKHLENQLRSLLESFVQGDNLAHLNETLDIAGDLNVSDDLDVSGDATVDTLTVTTLINDVYGSSSGPAEHHIYIDDDAPTSGDGTDGDIWFEY